MFSESYAVKGRSPETHDLRLDSLHSAIVDNFPGGLCVFDNHQRMIVCNERLKRMLDYKQDLFEFGMPTLEQVFRYNALRGEYGEGDPEKHVTRRMELARARVPHTYERTRPDGTVLQIRGVPLEQGGFLTLYFDVTKERNSADANGQKTDAEVLEGSLALLERLDDVLAKLRPGRVMAVHCFDLDKFGTMNSEYGRPTCDALLDSVTQRLAHTLREGDVVAHLSGDRYMVLQSSIAKPSDVMAVERRVMEAIRTPHKVGALQIPLSASSGISLAPRDGLVPEQLMARAEEMMLKAKRREPSHRASQDF